MVSETFISTILQASITGAGLILAVYGLIIPVFNKILNYRVSSLANFIKQIKEKPAKDFLFKEGSIEEVNENLRYIDEIRKLPSYFGKAVGLAFLGYLVSALLCLFWFLEWNKLTIEKWMPFVFGASCILFMFVGYRTIKDLIGLIKIKHENLLQKAAEEIDKKKSTSKRK